MTDFGLGLTLIESEFAVERRQVRFPRTKKRRIQKKWAKQEKNATYVPASYLLQEKTIVAHPKIAQALRDRVAREQEAWERKWS